MDRKGRSQREGQRPCANLAARSLWQPFASEMRLQKRILELPANSISTSATVTARSSIRMGRGLKEEPASSKSSTLAD